MKTDECDRLDYFNAAVCPLAVNEGVYVGREGVCWYVNNTARSDIDAVLADRDARNNTTIRTRVLAAVRKMIPALMRTSIEIGRLAARIEMETWRFSRITNPGLDRPIIRWHNDVANRMNQTGHMYPGSITLYGALYLELGSNPR